MNSFLFSNTHVSFRKAVPPNVLSFQRKYDFRIHGKKRMDLLLIGHHKLKKEKDLQELLTIIEKSKFLETAQKKIMKL